MEIMKTFNSTILKVSIYAVAFIGVFTMTSCTQNIESKDTKEIAQDSNELKFSNNKEADASFLVFAAEIHLEEISLGQLAQSNSTMPSVNELGKMMEQNHAESFKKLQALASQKQITIPTTITSDGKAAYDELKNKFEVDFNNEYCNRMVKGHEDAITKFEKAAINTKDEAIKSWAETTLASLKNHLAHAIACEESCAKIKSK